MKIWGPFSSVLREYARGRDRQRLPGNTLYITFNLIKNGDLSLWFKEHDIEFKLDEAFTEYYFEIDEELLALFILEFAEFNPQVVKCSAS